MIPIEFLLLSVSILFLVSIVLSKVVTRFGVPVLLLFLGVGMFFGKDGLGIELQNIELAQAISTFALAVILFSGGLDTKFSDIKPVLREGVLLSTVGVFLTALFTGGIIYIVMHFFFTSLDFSFLTCLLLASVMSSTDSASVFSILRSKGITLKNNLRPMLELESGSNDPMAYLMTITLVQILSFQDAGFANVALRFFGQIAIGVLAGCFLSVVCVKFINKINLPNDSLYPVLLFTCSLFIFSLTYFVEGNGYLAVYIAGLVIGNSKFISKRTTLKFFDGLAWISQISLFLTLGLLVTPRELLDVLAPGVLVSVFIIFVTRPLAVFLTLLPFKRTIAEKTFISWVGLRGAVPIVFAILPIAAGVPFAKEIFNIVFFVTLISLLLQGTTLTKVANLLKLEGAPADGGKLKYFDMELDEDIKSAMTEIILTDSIIAKGKTLMEMSLPDGTLAVMVKRGNGYFIPKGNTELASGDKLLILTDHEQALRETYAAMGISKYSFRRN
ncbi:MAG: potassium/proton antiporter [Deferribacteraceae bacterium]|jgi:cell volume regulation protein A|nr:potassium/proton antiporter [Deferribacteraceae bacterium]